MEQWLLVSGIVAVYLLLTLTIGLARRGVWTRPPSLRLGDEDRAQWEAIGESDRMSLRFRKPAEEAAAAE